MLGIAKATSPLIEQGSAELRSRIVPVALKIGRLGAAAQFLSGLRQFHGNTTVELLGPFENARQAMRRVQAEIREGRLDNAAAILDSLSEDAERLRNVVVEVDADATPEQTSAYVASARAVTADLLRRMVDFRLLDADRTSDDREKLLLVATALAGREPLDGSNPERLQRAFSGRGVLRDAKHQPTSENDSDGDDAHGARAAAVRRDIAQLADNDGIAGMQQRIREFRDDLGDDLFTLTGLCDAVSLEIALTERIRRLDCEQARPFDALVQDIEGVVWGDERGKPKPGPMDEALPTDDSAALELVATTGSELLQAIEADACTDRGFYLEPEELAAAKGQAADLTTDCVAMILKAAVYRTAIDRLARQHAKGSQPDGVEPPPISRATAHTLVERAVRIERQLADRNEQCALRGEVESAKVLTRCLHRLSRGRLGLALLADLPVNGSNPDDEAADEGPELTDDERKLREAKIYRDALTRDDSELPEVVFDPKRATGTRTEPGVPTRKPFLVLFAVITLITLGYHLVRLSTPPQHAQLEIGDLERAPVRVTQVNSAKKTLVVNAEVSWKNLSESERESKVRALWEFADARGYARVVLLDGQGQMPLAYASSFETRVLPEMPTND